MAQLSTILAQIDDGTVLLPEFQRGYVWNRDQVRGLMRSLYRGYPVGSLLLWQTAPEASTVRGDLVGGGVRLLLLDGQQRITSLYGVIRGHAPAFFEGDSSAFTGLHFNVEDQAFEFYAPTKMRDDERWINVTTLFTEGLEPYIAKFASEPAKLAIYLGRLNRLNQLLQWDFHEEKITGQDKTVDVVVDIFNRVNSSGTELSKGDLALAKLCAQWPDARQVMRDHLLHWKEAGYFFSLDWLLRNATAVATGRSVFTSLETVSAQDFSGALDRSARYISNFLGAVSGRLGLDHDRVLMGRGAIPVVSRLFHLTGGRFTDARQRDRTLFWYVHAGLWGRFASATETTLAQDYEVLERAGIDGLVGSLERWRGSLDIRPHDFEGSTRGSRFYPLLYMLTRVKGARDVGSGLQLRAEMLGHLTSLQVHHIFPKALLYQAGFERTDVNAIANFCFLTQETNLAVGKRRPEDYFAEAEQKHPGVLASQWIPDDPALWSVDRYWDFLAVRRELLADAAQSFLAELRDGTTPASSAVDLQRIQVVMVDADDVRAAQVKTLVEELVRLGCAEPALDNEIADPATGRQLAVAEAFWVDGLQPGQGRPVVLELDLDSADLPRMEELGYEVFTSVDALRGYVLRRNDTAAGDVPTVDESVTVQEPVPVAADALGPEFERAMHSIYDRARKEANYPAKHLLSMLAEHGALDTARRLLRAPAVSDGFAALGERGRLDLTVEVLATDPRYADLFTEEELETARRRLNQFGYDAISLPDQPNDVRTQPPATHDFNTAQTFLVLHDEHPMWAEHTGLDEHRVKPEWSASDLKQAQAFYERVDGKAKIFLDLLIDHPGRVLTVDELCIVSGGVFSGSHSVAGAVSGLYRSHQSTGRRYPFYWWSGDPTCYAMKPSVATLFHQARS